MMKISSGGMISVQLKRDTDYALRVLSSIRESGQTDRRARGLTQLEISRQSGIPRLAVGRICKMLCAGGILHVKAPQTAGGQETGDPRYYTPDGFAGLTLLDVVEASEGTGKIFAVFDRQSPMYRECEEQIRAVEDAVERELRNVSLKTFLKMHNNPLY